MNFLDLGLSEHTVKAVNESGIITPTTIQNDVIPAILAGKDIFTIAPRGCGKTMSYVLPLIDMISRNNSTNILIMTADNAKSVFISDTLALLNRFHQETGNDNHEGESDVIIGSPDLLMELVEEQRIDLSKVNVLVVDDINQIKKNKQIPNMEKVLEMLPADKQNIVYTTRRSRETQDILDKILKSPQEIKVDKAKEDEAQSQSKKQSKARRVEFDAEAQALAQKYNSFNGHVPNFLLIKGNLAHNDEQPAN
ncbi:MAG: DEAD/DEAH box helicase [Alphaproteobacteria bacterium]|nr:DEAD/DEAH box helicase [Alphaproteobacteria bacterium]